MVGIVAFLSGLAPFWGIIAGAAAVVLGVLALKKQQSKGMALTGLILGAVAVLTSLVTTITLVAGVGAINAARDLDRHVAPSVAAEEPADDETNEVAEPSEEPAEPAAPAAPAESAGQSNAARAAENYLRVMPFSRTGLIGQLEFEGYSTEDATYGVDKLGADWNEQAAKKAQSYLDVMPFSRSSLIDQLVFDGFTQAEAEYGVTAVGL
ncbi:MAG TPA: Ltp family lipoprotein [Protaetiibacter sp.]|nr:Ltp family lipoprotein [Protaetiibacter sp.]